VAVDILIYSMMGRERGKTSNNIYIEVIFHGRPQLPLELSSIYHIKKTLEEIGVSVK
jgi:hypothetical protein